MPESAAPQGTAARSPRPGRVSRASRLAWGIGWILLAAVIMVIAYGVLVFAGR